MNIYNFYSSDLEIVLSIILLILISFIIYNKFNFGKLYLNIFKMKTNIISKNTSWGETNNTIDDNTKHIELDFILQINNNKNTNNNIYDLDLFRKIKGKYYNLFYTLLGIAVVLLLSVFKFGSNISVSNLNFGMILYVLIAGMLAISAMVLPGISGSTVLLTFGLYVSIITAIKEVLSFDFTNLGLLIIFGLGVILGIIVSLKGIKKVLEKYRSATIYAVIGMMIGSLYAIVVGPETLEVPKEMMSFETFNIIYFVIGIIIVFGLEKIKKLPWYNKER